MIRLAIVLAWGVGLLSGIFTGNPSSIIAASGLWIAWEITEVRYAISTWRKH